MTQQLPSDLLKLNPDGPAIATPRRLFIQESTVGGWGGERWTIHPGRVGGRACRAVGDGGGGQPERRAQRAAPAVDEQRPRAAGERRGEWEAEETEEGQEEGG